MMSDQTNPDLREKLNKALVDDPVTSEKTGPASMDVSALWLCGCGHAEIVRDGSAPWAVRCSKCNSVRMLPPPP